MNHRSSLLRLLPISRRSSSNNNKLYTQPPVAAAATLRHYGGGNRRRKPRIVILGSGWGGNTLANRLDKKLFDVRLISPANHFLFTPLLPSTAVGTLEFRAIQEPIRTIPNLGEYYQAKARSLSPTQKLIHCQDLFHKIPFSVSFDYLCIATGNKTNTFNTPGVAEHEGRSVFFLKHLYHARQIRNRILECFERASNPVISQKERECLLTFVVVGGGPTSCEFTAELEEFVRKDVAKWYPDLVEGIRVTLVEAGEGILGSFHRSLSAYYLSKLKEKNVHVRLGTSVTGVHDRYWKESGRTDEQSHYCTASLSDGTELPFSTMVWSAGLAPVKFVENSGLELTKGRIALDRYLRVPGQKGRIFGLGDCVRLESGALPPTASVAEQQANYLADCFNNHYSRFDVLDRKNDGKEVPLPGPIVPNLMPLGSLSFLDEMFATPKPHFQYMDKGSMVGMGFGGGAADLTKSDLPGPKVAISGFTAFLMWRGAYWTKQLSYTNMMLIPMYWFKEMVFGRDISRF